MITRFTIFGERCSGTKYLQRVIEQSTNLTVDYPCGWKHFFGFSDDCVSNISDMLVLGIARDPYNWLYSFKKTSYHCGYVKNSLNWLDRPIISSHDNGRGQIIHDRNFSIDKNPESAPDWKSIFELRTVKLKYLIFDMYDITPNYKFINYNNLEDRIHQYLDEIYLDFAVDIKHKGVEPFKTPQPYQIPQEVIHKINNNLDWEIENLAGFNKVQP